MRQSTPISRLVRTVPSILADMERQKIQASVLETRMEVIMPFIREQLDAGGKVRFSPYGISMLPMLRQGIDTVTLSPVPERLKKYDLPVYRRKSGQYVMHRVVAVKEDHYVCLGDNTLKFEHIYPEQMIGVVSAFKRGSKRIEVDNPGYQLYCRLWRPTRPLRLLIYQIKRIAKKVLGILR